MKLSIVTSAAAAIVTIFLCSKVDACLFLYPYQNPGPHFVRARYVGIPLSSANTGGQMVIQGKLYYPAQDDVQKDTEYAIYFPPDTTGAPYPVVIFQPGANVKAVHLAL